MYKSIKLLIKHLPQAKCILKTLEYLCVYMYASVKQQTSFHENNKWFQFPWNDSNLIIISYINKQMP